MPGEGSRRDPAEGDVARPLAVGAAPEGVHTANELGVEADACTEPEPPPVDATERDATRPAECHLLGGAQGIPREPERTGEDTRVPAREKADGNRPVHAVQ